jgi:hypothetical protein
MRFATGPVIMRRDDDWRSALPPRQRALVGAVCSPLLRAYGYPLTVKSQRVPAQAQPHESPVRR